MQHWFTGPGPTLMWRVNEPWTYPGCENEEEYVLTPVELVNEGLARDNTGSRALDLPFCGGYTNPRLTLVVRMKRKMSSLLLNLSMRGWREATLVVPSSFK
jgi:hypothetical protein